MAMSRPVDAKWKMIFGYKQNYPKELQAKLGLKYHMGQDFACPKGTPVLSMVNGWWLGAKEYRGYGYMIEQLFNVGAGADKIWYLARYAHLTLNSEKFKKYGASVKKGAVIALSGGTGTVYYDPKIGKNREHPHLHVEVFKVKKVQGAWVRTELVSPAFVTGEELA